MCIRYLTNMYIYSMLIVDPYKEDGKMHKPRRFKNWQAICLESNKRLRLLVALATDKKLLIELQRGFPRLFTRRASHNLLRVPASALREAAEERSRTSWGHDRYVAHDRDFGWDNLADQFGLPCIRLQQAEFPIELAAQLNRKEIKPGMKVRWCGVKHYVIGLPDGWDTGDIIGDPKESMNAVDELQYIALAPCRLIDMKA